MTELEMYELATKLITDSIFINGCDRKHHRWCCAYHAGFEDGMDVLITTMMRGKPNA
jgi:hypothetical protein